ncbi:cytochrome c-type biogenesis protein CcmH [Polynucleobacter meluiroseus]|uniref:Cytochrome c-type biogenesis protein CcmH n=1 Tax=Polynucleobacter meluiroseus TaxID=1938814 RepID=A0A240DY37_9BURK|nr:c-type cytochrome biogenesis protein CcmI [Polynucleobacter meluiroseus]SNX28118.1 cytochrome c-type biogenesis protein CcmH [Polynucleobacter meluiroseus]
MTSFIISALLLLVLTLFLLLRPFFFTVRSKAVSRQQMNAAIYREELDKLEVERQSGAIDEAMYQLTHAELRQRLFQDTLEKDDQAISRSPRITIVAIVSFIAVFSIGFYLAFGDLSSLSQADTSKPVTQASVEKMVSEFALKLEKNPSDLKGWAMLARSYQILGRNQDAAKAYERAGPFLDTDPQLLANYADVLIGNANGNFAGKPLQLINQALKIDPNNLLALWLSGTAAFNSGNYRAAVQSWEKVQSQVQPQSEEAQAIAKAIAEARTKGKLPTPATPTSMPSERAALSGSIDLASALKAKLKPTDILMVIARKPGERMPVAVWKTPVTSFPMKFVLNDSMAMSPNQPISQLSEVTIEVRISESGMAMPAVGDLMSDVQTVKVGSNQVNLLVDKVRQ